MIEMVDRVARAVEAAIRKDAADWDAYVGDGFGDFPLKIDGNVSPELIARAAINAMAVPTPKMVEVADSQFDWGQGYDDAPKGPANPDGVYRAMVEAALEP